MTRTRDQGQRVGARVQSVDGRRGRPGPSAELELTAQVVAQLKPAARAYERSCAAVRGLVVRVHPSGTKSVLFGYNRAGLRDVVTLGVLTRRFTLEHARTQIQRLRLELELGNDPKQTCRWCVDPTPGIFRWFCSRDCQREHDRSQRGGRRRPGRPKARVPKADRTRRCRECEAAFESHAGRKYCTARCSALARRRSSTRPKPQQQWTCKHCACSFVAKRRRGFCSRSCASLERSGLWTAMPSPHGSPGPTYWRGPDGMQIWPVLTLKDGGRWLTTDRDLAPVGAELGYRLFLANGEERSPTRGRPAYPTPHKAAVAATHIRVWATRKATRKQAA